MVIGSLSILFVSLLSLPSMISIYFNQRLLEKSSILKNSIRNSLKISMNSMTTLKPVIILAGATSTGKSAVSMELIKQLDAEIVIADSVQVYKKLDIGSNKPTVEDQHQAIHHLLDIYDPSYSVTAGDFVDHAKRVIDDITGRNKVPIVVGGSTMWIQWLVHGIPDAPKASTRAVEEASRLLEPFELIGDWENGYKVLAQYDEERAKKLHKNDWYRLKRYLEVALDLLYKASSSPSSDVAATLENQRTPVLSNYDLRAFFLMEDRLSLYHTIDTRCVYMLQAGLIREVAELLLQNQLSPSYTVSKAIGYRQTIQYLCSKDVGKNNLDLFQSYISEFATSTRNYARRQHNWYRKDNNFMFLKIRRDDMMSSNSNSKHNKVSGKKRKHSTHDQKSAAIPAKDKNKPYADIAKEVLHWLTVSRGEYDHALSQQIECANLYNIYAQSKKLPPTTNHSSNSIEMRVLNYVRKQRLIKGGNLTVDNDTLTSDKSWSAEGIFDYK
jgi:tRNA dimethylallyltransferase